MRKNPLCIVLPFVSLKMVTLVDHNLSMDIIWADSGCFCLQLIGAKPASCAFIRDSY